MLSILSPNSIRHVDRVATGGEPCATLWRRVAVHLFVGLLLIIPFTACAMSTNGAGLKSGTPQANQTSLCPTSPVATAHSWVDSNRQITGSINGGPVGQISNFVYPLGLPLEDQFGPAAPSYTTWAPDGKHLATLVDIVVPFSRFSYPYIVDTVTKVATQVQLPQGMQMESPVSMEWARERSIAWADNDTLLIFAVMGPNQQIGGTGASQTTSYHYRLSTHTLTPLPGVTTAIQGVVRCTTLYYLELSSMKQFEICNHFSVADYWYLGGAFLHRYGLITQTSIGQPFFLGNTSSCPGFYDGAVEAMGWDVTADGKALVYQQVLIHPGPIVNPSSQIVKLQTKSRFMVMDVNNPGSPTPILGGAVSNSNAYLTISPDQQSVAVVATDTLTIADPSNALVYTGSIGGGAVSSHNPAAGGLPAWYADSQGFDTCGLWGEIPGATSPFVMQWQTSLPNAVGKIDGAHHPASLP